MNTALHLEAPLDMPLQLKPKDKPKMKRSIELKIKIKSLACEAHIIRHEENKLHDIPKWNLQHHRKTVVRDAARQSLMAYAFIGNRDVKQHMLKTNCDYIKLQDYDAVAKMVNKYGDEEAKARLVNLKQLLMEGK